MSTDRYVDPDPRFAEALAQIVEEAHREPDRLRAAPHSTGLTRLDEARAARKPKLRWHPTAEPS